MASGMGTEESGEANRSPFVLSARAGVAMRRWGPVLVLIGSLAGCAHADYGQLADSATTAVALSRAGFAEGNPLLSGLDWPEIAAAKLAITQAVKLTPEPICEPGLMGLTVFGYNAAVWNVAVLAGSGPAALPFMLLLTGWGWEWWWADAQRTCADPWSW